MNYRKKHWLTITACQAVAFFSIAILSTSLSFGQGNVDQFPTLPDTGNVDNGNVTNNNNGNNNGGNTTNVTDGGETDVNVADNAVNINVTDDQRNQGFVGATSIDVQEGGFIGVSSESSGSAPAEGANFGGGVNGSGGGNRGAAGRNAGFGAGNANGFVVSRRSLRAKVRPRFSFTPVSPQQVSNRFNNSFYRLPQSQNFSGQYQVSVQNRKATVTGAVSTQADMDKVIRQLRLQPGVYSIDNQLQVLN
jgi:hypothetical protein